MDLETNTGLNRASTYMIQCTW